MAMLARTMGSDVEGILGHSKADTTVNVYVQAIEASVKLTQDAIYAELRTRPKMAASIKKTENLVRFGTVGDFDGPEVIDPAKAGRLTQR